jgi:crossover junction endodeoxyribonuclease RuvC
MVVTVGIDLSLTATGLARSDGECVLVGRTGVTNLSIDEQIQVLNGLATEIAQVVTRHRLPDAICIEGLDMAQSYGGQIERTVLWWKVVELMRATGAKIYVAPSPQVKMYVTGKGSGPKGAVIEAVTRWWPQLKHRGDNNLADASACALIAAHMLGEPVAPAWGGPDVALPPTHTRALKSVRAITDPPSRKNTATTASPIKVVINQSSS